MVASHWRGEQIIRCGAEPVIKRIQKQLAESTCRTLQIVCFEVEHIQGAYEKKKGKISRSDGATGRTAKEPGGGSVCFYEDDGRFANGSKRDPVVRSGERALASFVSAEKGRTVARRLRQVTQPSLLYRHISVSGLIQWKQLCRDHLKLEDTPSQRTNLRESERASPV